MLCLKQFRHGERMYIFYPGSQQRTPFKRSGLFLLMDEVNEQTVSAMLDQYGLEQLCLDEDIILGIPVPPPGGWNDASSSTMRIFYDGLSNPEDIPFELSREGIPTLASMLRFWHAMNDVRYVIGLGTGSSYALRLAAEQPAWWAGLCAFGGSLPPETRSIAPMPAWLSACDAFTVKMFCQANQTDTQDDEICYCHRNPWQRVVTTPLCCDASAFRLVWNRLFRHVRRINTCSTGDITSRMEDAHQIFRCFIEDERLDSTPHTWFEHIPTDTALGRKLPMVVFFHGGSDNPAEAAEMTRLHDLGQREGFITVYPWATNRCSWNSGLNPELEDDISYIAALIQSMLRRYPIDPERIYLSGFSNGAAMAMSMALCHPGLIAGIFPIDSNWPGRRGAYEEIDWHTVLPFAKGMEQKASCDYLIPIWYTYGSRELSYPVRRGSSQQHQYDFWKMYNHITIRPTPEVGDAKGCDYGVPGDLQETLYPCTTFPKHRYEVQRFYDSSDRNLYNYVVMYDKGHEVAPMDAVLGWNYVRAFRRLSDGTLKQLA